MITTAQPLTFEKVLGDTSPRSEPRQIIGEAARDGILPLAMTTPGQRVKLVEIAAGRKIRHRLTELGLTAGVEMRIIQGRGGPMILGVHASRLALGRGMAHKIMVELL